MRYYKYADKNEENRKNTFKILESLPCEVHIEKPSIGTLSGDNVVVNCGSGNKFMSVHELVQNTMNGNFWVTNPERISLCSEFAPIKITNSLIIEHFEKILCRNRSEFDNDRVLYNFDKYGNPIILSFADSSGYESHGELAWAFRLKFDANNIIVESFYKYYLEDPDRDPEKQCWLGKGTKYTGQVFNIWSLDELDELLNDIEQSRLPRVFRINNNDSLPSGRNWSCDASLMFIHAHSFWK